MADEIDEALAKMMYYADRNPLLANPLTWEDVVGIQGLSDTYEHLMAKASLIRKMLERGGFVIAPATDELLRRGKESVAGGRVK